MVTNLTIWLPNGLKKIAFILTRRGSSRSELQKIIRMAVCRNLENLENVGSNRKSVLRARRTRRPKIAKFQNFQNSNRYDQNALFMTLPFATLRQTGGRDHKHAYRCVQKKACRPNRGPIGGPPLGPKIQEKWNRRDVGPKWAFRIFQTHFPAN